MSRRVNEDAYRARLRISVSNMSTATWLWPPTGMMTVVAPASIYFYGSTYYTFYNGAWYVSPRPRGPWNHFSGPPPWARKGRDGHWKEGHFRGPKH